MPTHEQKREILTRWKIHAQARAGHPLGAGAGGGMEEDADDGASR